MYYNYREKVKYGDILVLSYNIVGEKINTYKNLVKIQKLKQNLNKEVVWVMKDDSFVNLIYFLSIENDFNSNPISGSYLNNTMYTKKQSNNNLNNNNNNLIEYKKPNNFNKTNNLNINNNNKNIINSENSKIRITKKIIKRKNDMNIVNGGVINTQIEEKNVIIKSEKNMILKPSLTDNNSNNLINSKNYNYNIKNKASNYKKRPSLFKTEKRKQSSHDYKKDIKSMENFPQSE